MTNSKYPALLNKRARIFANLNRAELTTMALSYLLLSTLGISGVKAIGINIVILIVMKYFLAKTPRGYFSYFNEKKEFNWSGEIRKIYEK